MPDKNTLFYGDNLDVLPRIASESVDLIYLDPPFKSNAQYNVLFRTVKGDPSSAQIHAFDDTWSWSIEAESTYHALTTNPSTPIELVTFLRAMFTILGKSDMMAYLVMMAPRLVEMRRVLKPTGSVYLHCDPTASHYLKLLMDSVFGQRHFVNEVIWAYKSGGATSKYFAKKHDVIFFYSKSSDYWFAAQKEKSYMGIGYNTGNPNVTLYDDDDGLGPYTLVNMKDWWQDIGMLATSAHERLGYPTQKPRALLERIIKIGCPPDGVVLDPFCGCGTAVDAAQALGRRWIGIDIAYIAIDLIRNRLVGRYGQDVLSTFRTDGIPQDIEGADALAEANKIDFERWAVSLVRGQPTQASGDKGVDGWVYFARTYKEPLDVGKMVVSIKGGGTVHPSDVRDLSGTVGARNAQMGLLITRKKPSRDMVEEAAANGTYIHEATGSLFPKLQLMTVAELLAGSEPKIPSPLPPYMQASWAAASVAVPLF